jgi:hypothetical protein
LLEVVTCRAELKNRHRRRRWAAGILEVEKRHLYHRHRWAAGILEVERDATGLPITVSLRRRGQDPPFCESIMFA